MPTIKILHKGLSTLLNSAVIEILADRTNTDKIIEILKEKFTLSQAEIAKAFQDSYAYALAAISTGLVLPENQQRFWQTLFQSPLESELSTRIEQDYLQPFAKQQGMTRDELQVFCQTAAEQCQRVAKLTIFQAENVPFTEAELASFVTSSAASSISDLILAQIQTHLDKSVLAFLSLQELLGNALLFFLHEQLGKDKRFKNTLAALQCEGLMVEVRQIKQIVQTTEDKLNQAVAARKFGKLAELGPKLEQLQKIETVTQTHYAQFFEFSQRFAGWAQLISVQLEQIEAAMVQAGENNTRQILAIIKQLMTRLDLSYQIKPRDKLTQHSPASLKLIAKAIQFSKRIPTSDPQFNQIANGLGSVIFSTGNLEQAKALFIKALQQAQNDKQRALNAFNLFQVFIQQQVYDKALTCLQKAIRLNPECYALHNVHNYAIKRILGAGAMGCVLLCQRNSQLVVIKSFWETHHGSPETLFKEVFLMAKIAGDYVPQPLDCGFVDMAKQKRCYFITEYIEDAIDGETWLAQQGKLDIQTGIAVGLQVAKCLQLAHEKEIFHLDLKPAKILLKRQKISMVSKTSDVSVKIIDFGLAKVAPSLWQEMSSQKTRSGLSLLTHSLVFGTMDYTPPEQQDVKGYGLPSAKSDVYAFGKTMYRLLTGESPQTLHPRRLASAPALFELLCDCVEREPGKRVSLRTLISRLRGLLSPVVPQEKPVEKLIPPEQSNIRRLNKRTWWSQLDNNWKRIFKNAIGIDAEPTDSDFDKIFNLQKLSCYEHKISDLEPLRALTCLLTLDCRSNEISDLEPLRALTSLRTLSCYENKIGDLEPLRALMSLRTLSCYENKIGDLEPLRALTSLQILDCSYNEISDLEPLRALTSLQILSCSYNEISDLEPLRALTSLQTLYCWSNEISDLEPLRALTSLQTLLCNYNKISDLEPLYALRSLHTLDCRYNQISNLDPLRALRSLLKLDCRLNKLSDLEPLSALTSLQRLDCSYNQISDLEPLRALTSLEELSCWGNKISDLEPLGSLINLQELDCRYNQISDLKPLRALTSLRTLIYSDNPLSQTEIDEFKKAVVEKQIPLEQSNIRGVNNRKWWNQLGGNWKMVFKNAIGIDVDPSDSDLEKILNLQKLYCYENQIMDLEPLRALTSLQELYCSYNEIMDLKPLRALTSLQTLDCRYNEICDLEPLRALTSLQELYCWGNKISDLEPLGALMSLQALDCSYNKISDLEPLGALTSLQTLDCSYNEISDFEPLRALTSLRTLIDGNNPVSKTEIDKFKKAVVEEQIPPEQSICVDKNKWWSHLDENWKMVFKNAVGIDVDPTDSDFDKIFNLQALDCSLNKISDLEPLRALTCLQTLVCRFNKISDLEPLRALTRLQKLDCSLNKISDLEPLGALRSLQALYCSSNQISVLEPLGALTSLQILVCRFNKISDLERLGALTSLQTLDCRFNKISDLEPLRALTSLQTLGCSSNEIMDLEPLGTLSSLLKLDCRLNKISDLEPLRALTSLQTLSCSYNQISYLEPLCALTNLQELIYGDNPLSQAEIDKFKKAVPKCKVKEKL
ncbi:MAG: leucine-rich repeat domain-containing protein [Pseudomonadota bacterium]